MTATSSQPLQRVRDDDIDPAIPNQDQPVVLRNASERNLIAEAIKITKQRVQYSGTARRVQSATQRTEYTAAETQRPQSTHRSRFQKNKNLPVLTTGRKSIQSQNNQKPEAVDTMNEFINQKKQMFRVELANTEIRKEIIEIEKKTVDRKTALISSTQELETDKQELMTHMQTNKEEQRQKEMEEKLKVKEKSDYEDKLRSQDNRIMELQSEIEKKQELLGSLEKNKKFVQSLAQDEANLEDKRKEEMRKEIKKEWIERIMHDKSMDEIIFGFADIFPPDQIDAQPGTNSRNLESADILRAAGVTLPKKEKEQLNYYNSATQNPKGVSGKNLDSTLQNPKNSGALLKYHRKGPQSHMMDRQNYRHDLTRDDWGKIFEELMKRDLIDLPHEYTKEKTFFKDDEVEKIFEDKMDENMVSINLYQELEEQLDNLQKASARLEEGQGEKVLSLMQKQTDTERSIQKAESDFEKQKRSNMLSVLMDRDKDKPLDVDGIYDELRYFMIQVLVGSEGKNEKELQNNDAMQLMGQIEEEIIEGIKQFKNYDKTYQVQYLERKIRKDKQAVAFVNENKEREDRLKKQQELDLIKKNNRVSQKFGKMEMLRSDKPIFKKKIVKPHIEPAELDEMTYLNDFYELRCIAQGKPILKKP